MKSENQVCALDQAEKLKALGIKQQSEYYFMNGFGGRAFHRKHWHYQSAIEDEYNLKVGKGSKFLKAAFTSAELGEMLGSECFTMLEPGIKMHVWHCGSDNYEALFPADTEAQAKADMLIWMLEKGHRTAAEVNKALTA